MFSHSILDESAKNPYCCLKSFRYCSTSNLALLFQYLSLTFVQPSSSVLFLFPLCWTNLLDLLFRLGQGLLGPLDSNCTGSFCWICCWRVRWEFCWSWTWTCFFCSVYQYSLVCCLLSSVRMHSAVCLTDSWTTDLICASIVCLTNRTFFFGSGQFFMALNLWFLWSPKPFTRSYLLCLSVSAFASAFTYFFIRSIIIAGNLLRSTAS